MNDLNHLVEEYGAHENIEYEDWTPLHYASSLSDSQIPQWISTVISMPQSQQFTFTYPSSDLPPVVPNPSPLMIAVRYQNEPAVRALITGQPFKRANLLNYADQYGFTAVHYAVIARDVSILTLLIDSGAKVAFESKNGSTPLDLATALEFDDLIPILKSKTLLEKDPSNEQFSDWLHCLGAGEFVSRFLDAGYDLPFIARYGLSEQDLDCVGIPLNKLGIRRKVIALHRLDEFYDFRMSDSDEASESLNDSDDRSSSSDLDKDM